LAPLPATRLLPLLGGALMLLSACEPPDAPLPRHSQWVIHSKVRFVADDYVTLRDPLPLSDFRLTFPYVSGDLYGSVSIADWLHPRIQPDYTFEIDLNRTQADLVRSLEPTAFNESYLKIDPPEARIARLTPEALQADGIEPVALSSWVDPRTGVPLMLVYFDRPARITGTLMREGGTTRFDIRAGGAGYVWIGSMAGQQHETIYRDVDPPGQVYLALTPYEDNAIRLPPPVDNATTQESTTSHASSSMPGLHGAGSPQHAAAREHGVPGR
jgi:hypothetical protein